jgi:hypothetical protein
MFERASATAPLVGAAGRVPGTAQFSASGAFGLFVIAPSTSGSPVVRSGSLTEFAEHLGWVGSGSGRTLICAESSDDRVAWHLARGYREAAAWISARAIGCDALFVYAGGARWGI